MEEIYFSLNSFDKVLRLLNVQEQRKKEDILIAT